MGSKELGKKGGRLFSKNVALDIKVRVVPGQCFGIRYKPQVNTRLSVRLVMQHNYLAFNWGLENSETISWLSPFPSFLI